MEKYVIKDNIKVIGFEVKNFPEGIGEAFEALANLLSGTFDRSFYGIRHMDENGIQIYRASAEEVNENEAEIYQCERYSIEKGEYLCVTLKDWRQHPDAIKEVFYHMTDDELLDTDKPCIEWYKNDEEMLCMMKAF
jgi:hypothetical protein